MDISLREITENDTPFILELRNSEFVKNNFVIREQFTEQSQKKWLDSVVATGKAIQYIILNDNLPIGSVYIRNIDYTQKNGEFGIFMREDFTGKGFGVVATKEILKIAFEKLKLHRVYLRVFPDNLSAIKAYEKAGFIKEDLLRNTVCIDGEYKDMLLMGIVNNEK
ncbi:MAG: GNAT family N-acetyltransferase [Fibromonadaceae bacterium]|nr:GNAT family N-acetyltransferase [Fibromonadaceae bacterium]